MRRLSKSLLLAALSVLLTATLVLAAAYSAPLTVIESSSNAYTMLPVMVNVDNSWLAGNGFMEADALDTRVETLGGLERPHLVTDNQTLTSVAIPADSQTNLYFTTGNSDLTSMDIIVGYDGYITVTDVPALELGGNFTSEFSGYVDTSAGAGRTLIHKPYAYKTYIDGATNIKSAVLGTGGSGTLTLRPSAAGSETSIDNVVGAPTHWQATSDSIDNNYVSTASAAYQRDLYTIPDHTTQWEDIVSVTAYFRIASSGAGNQADARPALKTYGVVYDGNLQSQAGVSWSTKNQVYNTNPNTGAAWTWSEIDALEIGVSLKEATGGSAYATEVYIIVTYTLEVETTSVTAAGISSGEHVVRTTYDGADLKIFVDDMVTPEDTTAWVGSVPGNANNWILMSNAVPCLNYYKHTVSGTLIAWYQPITMIIGTVLPDREGAVQNGAITWGANPAGVAVTLGGLVSAEQPTVGDVTEEETTDLLPPAPVSDWFEEPDVSGALLTNPIRPFVTILSDTTSLSERQAWVLLGVVLVLAVAVGVGSRVRGHHLITGIAVGAAVVGLVVLTIFPGWAVVFTALAIAGGLVSERSPSL